MPSGASVGELPGTDAVWFHRQSVIENATRLLGLGWWGPVAAQVLLPAAAELTGRTTAQGNGDGGTDLLAGVGT